MIEKILFILFFIISFLIIKKYQTKNQAEKYKKKNKIKTLSQNKELEKILKKFNFLKRKDEYLKKQGYPLNINVVSYYFIKIVMLAICIVVASINYNSIIITILFSLTGYLLIDIYILMNKKSRNAEICTDLLNVSNSISLQLSANIMLKDSLKKQFQICKNKDFKKAMLEFATKYELSELNVEKPIKELREKFDITELNMFCDSLLQYNKVENIIEILENLSEILKEKYIEKLKSNTRNKIIYITFGVILALGNIILITFYPLFISIGQGFNTIFN